VGWQNIWLFWQNIWLFWQNVWLFWETMPFWEDIDRDLVVIEGRGVEILGFEKGLFG